MRILLLLFCLSCCLLPVPHVIDFLHILHKFYVASTEAYTVPLDPHILYCLNTYNAFVVITTIKPRLLSVVVFFYHTFFQQYGQTLHLRHQLTQRYVRFIKDFTTAILFILLFTSGPSRCWLFKYFAYILRCNDQNLHCTAGTSHFILFNYLQYICHSNDQ